MADQLHFNLKLYRERLNDKFSRNNSNQNSIDQPMTSQRKSLKKNIPTLDSMSSRLQNYSSNNKFKTDSLLSSPKNLQSPVKLNGMQEKIKSITKTPQYLQGNKFGSPISSPKNVVTQFQGFYQSPKVSQQDNNDGPKIKRYNSNNDITEQIPFYDLVNMRNKLENCDINAAHITPTYLTEIVKLAHVLNQQLQNK